MKMTVITTDLLEALLSPDDSRRRPAEAALQQMTPVDQCQALLQALSTVEPPHLVHMIAVLLRRAILKLTDAELVVSMMEPLLTAFFRVSCRTAMGDCLAEACAVLQLVAPEQCNAVLQNILQAIEASSVQGDVPSLRLLIGLADRAPRAFCNSSALQSLPQLVSTLASTSPTTLLPVLTQLTVTAALATTRLSDASAMVLGTANHNMDSDSAAAQLGRTCWPSLRVAWQQYMTMLATDHSASNAIQETLQHLVHAATYVPSLLAGDATVVLPAVCEQCLQVANCNNLDPSIRLEAVDVLATLCAVPEVKRQRLTNSFRTTLLQGPQGLIYICLQNMVQIDDDEQAWASDPATLQDDGMDCWEGEEDAVFAEQLLESLIQTFGSHALSVILPFVEQLLSGDWKMVRGALAACKCCLMAAPVSFAPHVNVAVQAALSFGTSPHVRVQFQALLLLAVVCESTKEQVREQYGARLLQTFSQASQSPCTKVAAMACLGIVSYCRGSGQDEIDGDRFVVPCVSDVLRALVAGPLSLELRDTGAVVVKVRAIGAVACLAQACGPAFATFYANVMPGLLACVRLPAKNHELCQLKGAAVEAATIVGQAIDDPCVFGPDAQAIMQLAVPILSDTSSENGIPLDQLLSACARIACVMGQEYAPYVDAVLPHLLQRAADKADVSLSEGDDAGLEITKRQGLDMDEDAGTESMTVALPGRGLTKVTINTTKIQEKAQAARAVYEHAAALGAAFGPYAKPCLDTFLLLVRFQYSAEIRSTAAQTLAAVFDAACAYGETAAGTMDVPKMYLSLIAKSIAKQIQEEDTADMENMFALADSLSDVYFSVYSRLADHGTELLGKFTLGDAKAVVQLCTKALVTCLERRTAITRILSGAEGALTGEDEREEYQGLLRAEETLLTPLVDSLGYSLKFFKESFVPIFESEIVPVLGPYLRAGDDIRARWSAVCLFDDCIEFCGPEAAAKFAPMLAEGAVLGLDDSTNGQDDTLKTACIYGIAQMARYAPSTALAGHAKTILFHLAALTKGSKEEADNVQLYENAVSALASLVLIGKAPFAATGFVKQEAMMKTFLASLPLREDEDEAKICHAGLCDLVEKGTVHLEENCEQLVRIIGATMVCIADGEDLARPDTCGRFAGILFQLQHQVPADRMNQAFGSLDSESQRAINSAMQQYAHHFANVVSP